MLDYKIVCPDSGTEEEIVNGSTMEPFFEGATDFFDDLARELLASPEARSFPELSAVGFWMRKVNINKLRTRFLTTDRIRLGRGVVFHIAPSNVDTIFLYSWFISLLSGNLDIIRLSNQITPQVEILLATISTVAKRHPAVSNRFLLVRYDHSEEITTHFSSKCSMRVIWGGDETIRRIRSIPLPPYAKEITFADKFSMALIKASAFLNHGGKRGLVEQFYNDAFWFGQMACSSPRAVVWVGSEQEVDLARGEFWKLCRATVARKGFEISQAQIMDKFVALCAIAINQPSIVHQNHGGNIINSLFVDPIREIPREHHCGSGLFVEFRIAALTQLLEKLVRKDQTLTYFGFDKEELEGFVRDGQPRGIDRFVPFGKALEFSPQWDGYDLFEEFTRIVYIK